MIAGAVFIAAALVFVFTSRLLIRGVMLAAAVVAALALVNDVNVSTVVGWWL